MMTIKPGAMVLPEEAETMATEIAQGEIDAQREADRVAAFCLSGRGHDPVCYEPAEPETHLHPGCPEVYRCETCGTDLSKVGGLDDPEWWT